MLNRLAHLEPKHWALIAAYLVSLGTVIGGFDHWGDLGKPQVVSGLVMQFATMLGAIFAGAPPNPNLNGLNNPARRVNDPAPTPPPLGSVTDATRRNLL